MHRGPMTPLRYEHMVAWPGFLLMHSAAGHTFSVRRSGQVRNCEHSLVDGCL